MVNNWNIIEPETEEISAMANAARQNYARLLPVGSKNAPVQFLLVRGRDAEELVRALERATQDLKNKKMDGLVAYIEAQELSRKHFAAIEMSLFQLGARHYFKDVKTGEEARNGDRILLIFSMLQGGRIKGSKVA